MAEKVKFVVLDEPKKTPVIIATRSEVTKVPEEEFERREAEERARLASLSRRPGWHPGP